MDTVKSSFELKLVCKFDDGDTRTITYENPKGNLTAQDIITIEQDMITNQPLIGDKTGARFAGFSDAYTVEQNKWILDI